MIRPPVELYEQGSVLLGTRLIIIVGFYLFFLFVFTRIILYSNIPPHSQPIFASRVDHGAHLWGINFPVVFIINYENIGGHGELNLSHKYGSDTMLSNQFS